MIVRCLLGDTLGAGRLHFKSRKPIPLREQYIPTLGMKCSHTGNQTFPYWGHKSSLVGTSAEP